VFIPHNISNMPTHTGLWLW